MIRFIARHPLLFGVLIGMTHLVLDLGIRILWLDQLEWLLRFPVASLLVLWLLVILPTIVAAGLPAFFLRRSGQPAHGVLWLMLILPLQFAANDLLAFVLQVRHYDGVYGMDSGSWLAQFLSQAPTYHGFLVHSGAVLAAPMVLLCVLAAEAIAARRVQDGRWPVIVPPEGPPQQPGDVVSRFVADHPALAGILLMAPLASVSAALSLLRDGSGYAAVGCYLLAVALVPLGAAAVVAAVCSRLGRPAGVTFGLSFVAPLELLLFTAVHGTLAGWIPLATKGLADQFRDATLEAFFSHLGPLPRGRLVSLLVAALGAAAGAGLGLLYARLRPRPAGPEPETTDSSQ